MLRFFLFVPILLSVSVASFSGCGSKPSIASEIDKTVAELEKAPTPAGKTEKTEEGAFDPAVAATIAPVQQFKDAISDYKAGKLEDAVTRLYLLRSQAALTPEQRMALQDSMASVIADIYQQAANGDARAIAAVAQFEKLQAGAR